MFKGCKIFFTCDNSWMVSKEIRKVQSLSHLSRLSLLRWQVSQKDAIYTKINRCLIFSEMFLPRVFPRLLLVSQPAQIQRGLPQKCSLQGLGRGGIKLLSGLGHNLLNRWNEGDIDFCYHSRVSNAGGVFGDSLCWNSWSLPLFMPVPWIFGPGHVVQSQYLSYCCSGKTAAWQLTAWKYV